MNDTPADRDDPLVRSYIAAGAPYAPEPPDDKVVAWLRSYIAPTAVDAAVEALAGDDPFHMGDMVALGPDICRRMGWDQQLGHRAVLREFTEAKSRVAKFIDQATKEIRSLAHERAPGSQMIRAVQTLAERSKLTGTLCEQESFIIPFCQRIAQAAVSGSRNVRGR